MLTANPLSDDALEFRFSNGESLDTRTFTIDERISAPYRIELTVRSVNSELDLEGLVGQAGTFTVAKRRCWTGIVRVFELAHAEPAGLSTYRLELVPRLWLLSQRRNYRIFQRMTEIAIVEKLLDEWHVQYESRVDTAAYAKRDYRVQYAESDFSFVSRMLEDAGISYWFEQRGSENVMILADAPHTSAPRAAIPNVDDPSAIPPAEFVTEVSLTRELRPGRATLRDVDFRLPPAHALISSAAAGGGEVERSMESFHFEPGAFLFEGKPSDTPSADDKMAARSSEREAERLAQNRLDAGRGQAFVMRFFTNVIELGPGTRVAVSNHSRSDIAPDNPVLITQVRIGGEATGRWSMSCRARPGDAPFRPELVTPKPRAHGVETATVVGPRGEEIHTDEFGRVRVHFHWDRLDSRDDESSCWIPVSHPWAGAGFGSVHIPRVGQEVVVDFVTGDPDRPIVVGRIYTASQPVPYKLPEHKTQSGWKSNSTARTGGYNEIMMEDAAGKELLRVQAERDMVTLVKHDVERTIQHDETIFVDNDQSLTVKRNRTKSVGSNERVSVGQNQRVAIGVNRATQVGLVDSLIVGETFVVQVAPPGEGPPAPTTSIQMTNDKIVFGTPGGATLALDGNSVTIKGAIINIEGGDVKISGVPISITSDGLVAINGNPINLNC